MRTVGIDMAAQPANTAAVVIEWPGGGERGIVTHVVTGVDDEALLSLLADADMTGIDAPLGWPDLFVGHVRGWHEGQAWPSRYGERGGELRYRRTDRRMAEAGFGWPLSVSTDRIATLALRTAWLLSELERSGRVVDRSGTAGCVAECWPRAGRQVWDASTEAGLGRLRRRTVTLPRGAGPLLADAHASDALVAALMGRAVALDLTAGPSADDAELARAEGWIHVPATSDPEALLG